MEKYIKPHYTMPVKPPVNEKAFLTALANELLLNGSYLQPNGLNNGKMGIVIYLFELGKYLDKVEYSDYAFSLLEQILSTEYQSENNDMGFETGISGIGTTTIRLIQAGHFEADINEMMGPIDNKIYRQISLLNYAEATPMEHIAGAGFYLLERLKCLNSREQQWQRLIAIEHLLLVTENLDKYFRTEATERLTYLNAGIKILLGTACLANNYRDHAWEKLQPIIDYIKAGEYENTTQMPGIAEIIRLTVAFETAACFKKEYLLKTAHSNVEKLFMESLHAAGESFSQCYRILAILKIYKLTKQTRYKTLYNTLLREQIVVNDTDKEIIWGSYSFTGTIDTGLALIDKYTHAFSIFDEYLYLYH